MALQGPGLGFQEGLGLLMQPLFIPFPSLPSSPWCIPLWGHSLPQSRPQELRAFFPGDAAPLWVPSHPGPGWEGHSLILSCCGAQHSPWESAFPPELTPQLGQGLRCAPGITPLIPSPPSPQTRLSPSKPRAEL